MTVTEKVGLYTNKDVRKALEASEFLKALGYPSEREAITIVQDGNALNVPHCIEDIKRFFDIYGAQIPSLRGKTMKNHAKTAARPKMDSKF
jgi:hypothetical protein